MCTLLNLGSNFADFLSNLCSEISLVIKISKCLSRTFLKNNEHLIEDKISASVRKLPPYEWTQGLAAYLKRHPNTIDT